MILSGVTVSTVLWANPSNPYVWIVLGVTLAFGLVGFYDDYLKVTRQTHSGFAARTRIIAEVLIAAGGHLHDDEAREYGLELLDWLLETETSAGRLSPTGSGGWSAGEPRPCFDQQPIEAAALADACARAYAVSGDERWLCGVDRAVGWFLGENDADAALHDPHTGGGYDGLSADGPNANQGAESTLALISTLQQAVACGRAR